MACKKDYFGIALGQFKAQSRNEKRESVSLSLFDQLKKFGTAQEKAAIRALEAKQADKKARSSRMKFDSKPDINPYS